MRKKRQSQIGSVEGKEGNANNEKHKGEGINASHLVWGKKGNRKLGITHRRKKGQSTLGNTAGKVRKPQCGNYEEERREMTKYRRERREIKYWEVQR